MRRNRRRSGTGRLGRMVVAVVLTGATVTACETAPPFATINPPTVTQTLRAPSLPALGISPGYSLLTLDTASLDQELDFWRSMGMGWVRVDLDFPTIGARPGTYDWSAPDRVFAAARLRDLRIIAVPTKAPAWLVHGGDAQLAHGFAAFAAAAAGRYAPIVDVWEIWNEPNSATFWPGPPDIDAYAAVLATTAAALEERDPTAVILSGGLARAVGGPSVVSPLAFVRGLYRRGALGSVDGIAVHPYSYPDLPSSASESNPFQQLPEIRRVMVRNGDADQHLWITEFGAPTGTHERAVSEERQAAIISDALRTIRSWPWVGPTLLYSGRDLGPDPGDLEQNFGVVTLDFRAKMALSTLRAR